METETVKERVAFLMKKVKENYDSIGASGSFEIGNAIAGAQRVSTELKLSEVRPSYANGLSAYVFCVLENTKQKISEMSDAEIEKMLLDNFLYRKTNGN